MKRKLLYLVNPNAGASRKEVLLNTIYRLTAEQNFLFESIITNPDGNYDLIKEKVETEGITDVIIIGGDGTVSQVVNALRSTNVRFGIIPMGSGNGLAYAAGISGKPLKALEIIFKGESKPVDAFLVNKHFSCMLSGIGFDAKVAHEFAHKATRGLLTYTKESVLEYFKAHPYQFEIILDGFSFFTEAFFISIANSNQFGNHVTIAPEASLNDGLMDIVIVQKMNKAKLPFAILRQIRGNNKLQQLVMDISQKTILYFQAPAITIRNLKLAPFHIDGEPVETSTEFHASVIPNCFQLMQPA